MPRDPAFWWRPKPTPAARLLSPLAGVFAALADQRLQQKGVQAAVPIVCVGNFVVGGAGKTPTAIALARRLWAMSRKPFFVSRGYGGRFAPVSLEVDLHQHGPQDVGDEALLLADVAPTIVTHDRRNAAALAMKEGADCVILDDGLQDPLLKHDLRLGVVDGAVGIGNGLCLPAGPLRASWPLQLAGVSALVIIGEGAAAKTIAAAASAAGKPVLTARLVPDAIAAKRLAGRDVVAFAGIGRPQKFFDTLAALGARLVATRSFADHHVYREKTIIRLQALAASRNALLVTTQKDMVRIAGFLPRLSPEAPSPSALPVDLHFDDPASLDRMLEAAQR